MTLRLIFSRRYGRFQEEWFHNSYILIDDKVVLIDTVLRILLAFLDKIKSLLPEGKKVDYLVVNHMEPDHSVRLRF